MRVTLVSSSRLIERYRELLRQDWNEVTVTVASTLIRDLFKHSGVALVFEWEKSRSSTVTTPYPITREMSEHLVKYLKKLNLQLTQAHEKGPDRKAAKQVELRHRATECAYLLHVRRDKDLSGATGLLRDIQSILFNGCVMFLLPELRKQRLDFEHDNLLDALYAHAIVDWADDPVHEMQLKSLIYDYIGAREEKERFLSAAFHATAIDEHDYLTKAQALWFEIMDKKEYSRAFEFLLNLYRRALPEQLDEVRDMIDTTVRMTPHIAKVSA